MEKKKKKIQAAIMGVFYYLQQQEEEKQQNNRDVWTRSGRETIMQNRIVLQSRLFGANRLRK
ncbi:MAG: hypothetical protein APR54_04960 [Candidatus Cloacimonas sp. SDB]|nr:MAG: hypothetical protein APR54_04960 [Candidatus Cloacimonas sp. SDB]